MCFRVYLFTISVSTVFFPSSFWAVFTNSVSAMSAFSKSKCLLSHSFAKTKKPPQLCSWRVCVWPKVVAAVTRDNPGWLNSYLQLFPGTFQHSYTIYSLFIAPKRKQDLKSCLSKGTFSCVLCVSARSLSAATANMKFPSLIQLDGWQ